MCVCGRSEWKKSKRLVAVFRLFETVFEMVVVLHSYVPNITKYINATIYIYI